MRDGSERRVRELVFGVCVKWAEVEFNFKFKRCVLHLFFFILFFEFRPESTVLAISADMARVGLIQQESARVRATSARISASRLKERETHVARRGQSRR